MTAMLSVEDLVVTIGGRDVVEGVTFEVVEGGRLGVIGESGSGKTMTALAIAGLTPDAATIAVRIRLDGVDLVGRDDKAYAALRGDRVAMVFQDPMTSLNPVMRVGRVEGRIHFPTNTGIQGQTGPDLPSIGNV